MLSCRVRKCIRIRSSNLGGGDVSAGTSMRGSAACLIREISGLPKRLDVGVYPWLVSRHLVLADHPM
jgi:hypothetical protein